LPKQIDRNGVISDLDNPEKRVKGSNDAFKEKVNRKEYHRKLRIGNGYLLEFGQLARVLNYLFKHRVAKKINRKELQEETGLSDRHIESLISMGSAMGLIKPRLQVLMPTGCLIANHDIFFERTGTLEWCHYVGASSFRNLIWFEIFNNLLHENTLLTQEEWIERFRAELSDNYSKRTINRRINQEVYFVIDAYLNQSLSNLGLLKKLPDERLYGQRYTDFAAPVFAAMLYDFFTKSKSSLYQVIEIVKTPGSPAMVFKLDEASFRKQIENLHNRGWLRYETTHNLDQIRLKPGFNALEFLTAYYEDRAPCANSNRT
jgi:hypothetical protein